MGQHDDNHETPQQRITRETEFQPYERNRPIPIAVLSVAFALAAWGALTLWMESDNRVSEAEVLMESAEHAGAGADAGAEATATGGTVDNATRASADDALIAEGAAVFEANCVTCHRQNGLGMRGAVPPLDASRYVVGPAEAPVLILLHGIAGPISVAGTVYDGRMPRFGEVLDDREIAAVVSYIRQNWSNAADALSVAMVAEQRERFAADRGPWNGGAELERVTGIPAGLEQAAARSTQEDSQ